MKLNPDQKRYEQGEAGGRFVSSLIDMTGNQPVPPPARKLPKSERGNALWNGIAWIVLSVILVALAIVSLW
jgi:hypothetical protein